MSGSENMNAGSSGVKLTYDDFVLFPDDGMRHELIDGEHYVTPSPNVPHQGVVGNLHWLIRSHLESHPSGRVFVAPLDVIFSKFDVVEPDLLYISHERAARILGEYVHGSPELVVEVGSPATRKRDETVKLRLYERAAVDEYWVVDPKGKVLRVYRRSGQTLQLALQLSSDRGDVLTTPLLPGLGIRLIDVFRE
jgi:Uma2 family endonuclease